MKVLVVDDEPTIVEAVAYNLKKEGFSVLTASDAGQCLEIVKREQPNMILLDVMLSSGNGFDVCRILRKQSDIPIILLTAKADEMDRVIGLELGADDYVTKPFSMRELVARVKSVLRRTATREDLSEAIIKCGSLEIDSTKHEVRLNDKSLSLSPKEFELLKFLVTHADQVFDRQTLLDRVWGSDAYVEERTVDVHIRWLRAKIETDPAHPRYICTVRGLGYIVAAPTPGGKAAP